MKFNLNDFLQLDTTALLAVNGGGSCGGSSNGTNNVSKPSYQTPSNPNDYHCDINSYGGNSYHVWNSDGIKPVSESDWSLKGTAVSHSTYVPLN